VCALVNRIGDVVLHRDTPVRYFFGWLALFNGDAHSMDRLVC
jgi:hypothetical protein